MKAKRLPNAFRSLYMLAKRGDFDTQKWRNLLVGVHRKRNDKQGMQDICLLFYSLARGKSNQSLSSLEVTYNSISDSCVMDEESTSQNDSGDKAVDRNEKLNKEPITFTLESLVDLYFEKVLYLLKYMSTFQLSMVVHALFSLNKLDDSVCNIILGKLNSKHLTIYPRSFSVIVFTLSKSGLISKDSIEMLLLQNLQILSQMSKIDLSFIIKAVSEYKIKNSEILNVVLEKVSYFSNVMNKDEILLMLKSLYKLDHLSEDVSQSLYTRTQNLLKSFNLDELLSIAKYFSYFKPEYAKDFFEMQLSPIVHEFFKSYKTFPMEESHIIDILRFYVCSVRSGSSEYPLLLKTVLESLTADHQWNLVFFILQRYLVNNKSVVRTRDYNPEDELWAKSISLFANWLDLGCKLSPTCITLITKNIVDSEVYNEALFGKMLDRLLDDDTYPSESIAQVLYNLHPISNGKFDDVCTKFLQKNSELDFNSTVLMLSVLFSRDIFPPEILISTLKSAFDSPLSTDQSEPWELPSGASTDDSKVKMIRSRILRGMSLDTLQYLLFAISLYNPGPTSLYNGNVLGETSFHLSMDTESRSKHLSKSFDEICTLYTMVETKQSHEIADDLVKPLLYVIKNLNVQVYKRIVKSDCGTRVVFETIPNALKIPLDVLRESNCQDKVVDSCIVRFGDITFEPIHVVLDEAKMAFVGNKCAINKFNIVKIKLLCNILHVEGFEVVIYPLEN